MDLTLLRSVRLSALSSFFIPMVWPALDFDSLSDPQALPESHLTLVLCLRGVLALLFVYLSSFQGLQRAIITGTLLAHCQETNVSLNDLYRVMFVVSVWVVVGPSAAPAVGGLSPT